MSKPVIIIILAVATLTAYGQTSGETKAIFGYKVDEWLSYNLREGELMLDNVEHIRRPDTKIAIRVCTELPLAQAIRQSKSPPFRIAHFFMDAHAYNNERLLYLRSKECHRGGEKISAIEVWVVPKGASLPPADDVLEVEEAERIFFGRGSKAGRKG